MTVLPMTVGNIVSDSNFSDHHYKVNNIDLLTLM